ncbi:MAG TPA: CAP domain-containing protein [Coxiellaceae bacterium]|nr:CAP domain-containing protein [Coxiellaceae bacterium]
MNATRIRLGLLFGIVLLVFGLSTKQEGFSAQEILNLVNHDRQRQGLEVLTLNPTLNLAAFAKAEDMVSRNYFAHVGPDGSQPWDWFEAMGYQYTYAGENLAVGYSDPHELESSWMSSPQHRANILSPFYSDIGLAVVTQNNTTVVVQFFGSKQHLVTLRE